MQIEDVSPSVGGTLVLRIEGVVCDGKTNLDAYVDRVGDDRDEFCFGWGVSAADLAPFVRVEQSLPDELGPGLYSLAGLQLSRPGEGGLDVVGRWTNQDFGLQLFAIGEHGTPSRTADEVRALYDAVVRRRDEDFLSGFGLSAEAPDVRKYQVLIFAKHGLLTMRTRLGQYEVIPIEGMGVEGELTSVETFLKLCHQPPLSPEIVAEVVQQGMSEQPCFVVHFPVVFATSAPQARALAASEVRNLSGVISLYRDGYPAIYAQLVRDLTTGNAKVWTLDRTYRGNRIGGFLGGERPGDFVRGVSKARGDDRLALYLDMYRAANAETSREARYFLLWSLLETMANRVVHKGDPRFEWDGTCSLGRAGKPLTIQTIDQLVFEYLRCVLPGLPIRFPFALAARNASLKDSVAIWYRHRNCLVHHGGCFPDDPRCRDSKDRKHVQCRAARNAMAHRDGDADFFRDDDLESLCGTARACVAAELL